VPQSGVPVLPALAGLPKLAFCCSDRERKVGGGPDGRGARPPGIVRVRRVMRTRRRCVGTARASSVSKVSPDGTATHRSQHGRAAMPGHDESPSDRPGRSAMMRAPGGVETAPPDDPS
jgi:hypothetical protein